MTKNIEIEQKVIITKEQFNQVLNFYSQTETITQTNYYFDSDSLFLRSKGLSLRVRIFNDLNEAEQTLKIHKRATSVIKHELYELTDPLSINDAKKIITNSDVIFKKSVGAYLINRFSNLKIKLQTNSRTTRHLLLGPKNVEITLDQTTYPDGFIDYELEIENSNSDLIIQTAEILSNQFKFNFRHKSPGKISRSFQHR